MNLLISSNEYSVVVINKNSSSKKNMESDFDIEMNPFCAIMFEIL